MSCIMAQIENLIWAVVKNIENGPLNLASKFEFFSRVTLKNPQPKIPIRGLVLKIRGFQILSLWGLEVNSFEDPRKTLWF